MAYRVSITSEDSRVEKLCDDEELNITEQLAMALACALAADGATRLSQVVAKTLLHLADMGAAQDLGGDFPSDEALLKAAHEYDAAWGRYDTAYSKTEFNIEEVA